MSDFFLIYIFNNIIFFKNLELGKWQKGGAQNFTLC